MPFHLRIVQPSHLGRLSSSSGHLPQHGTSLALGSLDEVSSHTLVHIIQQLSDLSRHAEDIFNSIHSQAVAVGGRSAHLQRRLVRLLNVVSHLDHRKVPVPVSNLDEESKWTVHYTAAWHQQENVFLPSSRPSCVEDLHKEAKLNLKTVLRECDKLRRDGYRSSQYYSQGPTFSSSTNMVCTHYQEDNEEQDRKFSVSSSEEEKLLPGKRPKTPVSREFSDTHTNWTKSLPLPTPEEKMRQEAQAIHTDVIPINVSGENFDRQASFRRSLIHTDTVVRRPKKVKRRKTITGVPDNIQKELAGTGQKEFRGHSLHIPDDYNPLDTCRPAIQRADMKDFSCQTDDMKVIPPSVRRIRAQKGQGIAALMSSSSGNMSTLSDSQGAGSSLHVNGDLNFRSLPRPGARVSLQTLEQKPGEITQMEDSFISLPRQLSKLQVDETVVHLRNNPRVGPLQRPKSQEVRGSESDVFSNPACTVSPHAAYSTSVIPNAMLSSSSEVITIHTSQSTGQLEGKVSSHGSSIRKKAMCQDRNLSVKDGHHSLGDNWSESSSTRHSQTSDVISPNAITVISIHDSRNLNNIPQNMSYKINAGFNSHSQDSDTHSESSCSDSRQRNGSMTSSIASTDHWSYEMADNDTRGPSRKLPCAVSSSPVSNMSTCSSERKADTGSLYSVDHDGYYTSMHVDSGIGSGSQNNIIHNPRHSVINIFDKKDTGSVDSKSNYSDRSLTRSISLKKSKKPPPPPSRTDSLRRPQKKNVQSNGQVLSETLIASLQQSLHLNLKGKTSSSASQSPCSDYEDPWVLRSRSQSTVSASSSGMSATANNLYSICAVTPSQSETSSIKSDYADHWSYIIDYARTSDEQSKSLHSPNRTSGINDYNACELRCGVKASVPHHGGIAKPNGASPEKPCRVTSPSSGYSSQSNTPTTLTPVPALLRNMSPGNGKNKMKPKVPERRSSLISSLSISSSSTSLSSNTSDSIQQSIKKSNAILIPHHTPPTPPLTPDPPPPPTMDIVDIGTAPSSPNFPPPPPEVTMFPSIADETPWATQSQNTDRCAPVSCPPPPPLLIMHSKVPPPAPPLNTKVLKTKIETTPQRKEGNDKFNNQDNKQELLRPVNTPLVTAHALQMVQLRSVKKSLKLDNEKLAEQEPEPKLPNETSSLFSRPSLAPSVTLDLNTSVNSRENKNSNTSDNELQSLEFQSNTVGVSAVKIFPEQKSEDLYQTSIHNGNTTIVSRMSSPKEKSCTPQTTPNASPNKKPPPVSKKPKLFLVVPPPQLDLAAEKIEIEVNENVRSMPNASERESISKYCEEVDGRKAAEKNPVGEAGLSSCEVVVDNILFTPHLDQETETLQKEGEQLTMSEVVDTPDCKTVSPRCVHKVLEEEESVFETGNISPLPLQTSIYKEDHKEQVMTPTRPRTTEDLFAAIHRSKRKVLGRKDSDDDRCRTHSPSPPVTPTGGAPNISTFKQTGAIQRGIRKSTTSSDNFKALLLKKGSRSECGSRMSAAEMLKHTDPRFQRSRSESSVDHPESPTLTSPNKNKRAQEEWAKSEGLMPRSMSVSGTRYSRSRTPPSAASSKYNVRSRLQSSPMTVICEGEGEAADTVESFPKMPLLITKSLDRFDRSDSEMNESLDSEGNNGKVDIDLMSRLLQSEGSDPLEEKS